MTPTSELAGVDLPRLLRVVESFCDATGLAAVVVDALGRALSPAIRFTTFCQEMRADPDLRALCERSDAHGALQAALSEKPRPFRCHAGLVDFAVPIIDGSTYRGAVLCGQVRPTGDDDAPLPVLAVGETTLTADGLDGLLDLVPKATAARIQAAATALHEIVVSMRHTGPPQVDRPDDVSDAAGGVGSTRPIADSALAETFGAAIEARDLTAMVDSATGAADEAFAALSPRARVRALRRIDEAVLSVARDHAPTTVRALERMVLRARAHHHTATRFDTQLRIEDLVFTVFDAAVGEQARHSSFVAAVKNYLARHPGRAVSVREAAVRHLVSESHLSRRFKSETGVNYVSYATARRINRAKLMLTGSPLAISDIAKSLDFNQTSYFSHVFREHTGMTPTEFRNQISEHS